MARAASKTVLSRLVVAAIALAAVAGCQVDRPRSAWRSPPDGESRMACPGRCRGKCVPCSEYQPTVWESWNSGPMAVRGCDHVQCAEPDGAWLSDLPKPAGASGVKSFQETIPAPPARANEGSTSGLGDGFKLQPPASADSANGAAASKPKLGEGFKLAPQGEHESDDTKPPIKGLEPTPANPPSEEKPAPPTADGNGTSPPAAQQTSPAAARFEPEPSASDTAPAAQPSLLPP